MRVIALELGYDNVALRNAGDEFEMPDDVFERRPRMDTTGQVIPGLFYEPPHWFEPVDKDEKAKVAAERKAVRKANATVQAIDPAKQAAEYQASLEALTKEVDALKVALAAQATLLPAKKT